MLKRLTPFCVLAGALSAAFAQSDAPPQGTAQSQASQTAQQPSGGLKQRPEGPVAPPNAYEVAPGTHILLNMINSVSTKQAQVGDRIYLETAFPVIANGRILIPQGSWVTGTITEVKRPGRVKGRGELQVKFDSLTLPNGVSRVFRSDLGALDATQNESVKREQSKVTGPGDKKGDVGTVVGSTTAGTVIGSGIGAAAGNVAKGAGIGVGAGAAAGLLGVLLTRGPDATLSKGSSVEMVLDRPLTFTDQDLNFNNAPPSRGLTGPSPAAPTPNRGFTPVRPY